MTSTPPNEGAGAHASVVLLLLLTLPFAGRAHNIDDPLYLEAARRVLAAPLDPLGGASFWHDRPARLFDDLYNPPLTAYVLSLAVALDGGSEVAVHSLVIALSCAALLAFARASAALGLPSRLGLLLAASPALVVSAVSAMTDVPFLLASLLAWEAALRGRARVSGALAGLSALTKYAGLLNLGLVLLPLRRGGARAAVVALLVGGGLFGGWCAWSLARYGALHVSAASRFAQASLAHQRELILASLAALGLAGAPAAVGLLRWTRTQGMASVAAGLLAAAVIHARTGIVASAVLAFTAVGTGTALVWAAAAASLAPRREAFAAACFWSYAAYTALIVYFGAVRYVLPLLPPLLWLLARSERIDLGARPWRWRASVGTSACLSLLLLAGDAGYADAWRSAAARLPETARGFAVGHWGFQWYAGARGYRPLDPREALREGDVVAQARGIHVPPVSRAQAVLLVPQGVVQVPSPALRVMDRSVGAGFYSDAWGALPFAFRRGAREEVALAAPAAWLLRLIAEPSDGPVVVDFGSAEASAVRLDGWSEDEAFDEAGARRTFVWAVGEESALRVPLPAGVGRLRIAAAAAAEAVGPLWVDVGPSAHARVDLRPGWHTYEAAVEGEARGGPTTVVLRPAGRHRPGPFDRERREVSVAVDVLAFGDAAGSVNRGAWPVRTPDSGVRDGGVPGLTVAEASIVVTREPSRVRGRARVLEGSAALVWDGHVLWTSSGEAECRSGVGCAFEATTPPGAGTLRLRADRAVVSALEVDASGR